MGHDQDLDQTWSLSITTSKLSVKTDFDLSRQSRRTFAPTTSKAMSAITNQSNKHVGNNKADRNDRNLWIYGYDASVGGSAVTRLKKIIWGLRRLTMVDEEALNTFERPISTIRQLDEVKLDKVPLVFNHPGSKGPRFETGGGSAYGGRRNVRNSDVRMARKGNRAHERRRTGSRGSAGQIRGRPHHHGQTTMGQPQLVIRSGADRGDTVRAQSESRNARGRIDDEAKGRRSDRDSELW